MNEVLKAFARAIAAANGHPDPDAYAEHVAAVYVVPTTAAESAPATTTTTEPTEPAAASAA